MGALALFFFFWREVLPSYTLEGKIGVGGRIFSPFDGSPCLLWGEAPSPCFS